MMNLAELPAGAFAEAEEARTKADLQVSEILASRGYIRMEDIDARFHAVIGGLSRAAARAEIQDRRRILDQGLQNDALIFAQQHLHTPMAVSRRFRADVSTLQSVLISHVMKSAAWQAALQQIYPSAIAERPVSSANATRRARQDRH